MAWTRRPASMTVHVAAIACMISSFSISDSIILAKLTSSRVCGDATGAVLTHPRKYVLRPSPAALNVDVRLQKAHM